MVNLRAFKNINPFILTALTALAAFLALFAFLSADDNRLFNWQWVFTRGNIAGIFLFLILGMIAAYLLARAEIFERRPVAFLFLFSFVPAALLWTEPELMVLTTLLFSTTVVLTYYIGKTLWTEELGFFAGMILLVMPVILI